MARSMKEHLKMANLMEKEALFGQMVNSTTENMLMTRNKVMEYSFGLTEENMKVIGLMDCRMVPAFFMIMMDFQIRGNGRMVA